MDLWWRPLHGSSALKALTALECLALLSRTHVGRLAYVTDRGPRVVPMNFAIAGNNVIFRTSPDTEAARFSRGRRVAFEIDQVDELKQTGWSVLILGVADECTLSMLQSLDAARTPDPWPEGMRSLFLHIPLFEMTGRLVRAH